MDCVDDPTLQSMTLMFASQVLGKTEIETNIIGSQIDEDPCPIMMTLPTHQMSKGWSRTKLQPMIDTTPTVRDKLGGPWKKQKRGPKEGRANNTIQMKEFPGGFLVTGGANSPAGLSMYTVKISIFDEPDRYPQSSGEEGDPIGLGDTRTENIPDAFSIYSGTPTVRGFSRIEIEYERTDKRKWFVRCDNPDCPQPEFVIMFDHIQWDKEKDENGKTIRHFPETAHVECPACGHSHTDEDRQRIVRKGRWIAQRPEVKNKRGYWANAFLCLLKPKRGYLNRLHQWAADFLDKKAKGPEMIKGWTNTVLAESYEEEYEKPTAPNLLFDRREDYFDPREPRENYILPKGVLCLTAAFDVQKNRVEGGIIGWGLGEEAWWIDYRVFVGNSELVNFWGDVDEWMQTKWKHPCGKILSPAYCAIDANYVSRRVYWFVKKCQPRRVVAVRGVGSDQMPWVNRSRNKTILWNLNVNAAKAQIFSRLSPTQSEGPGYVHFPETFDLAFFEQLTAERIVTTYSYGIPQKHFVLPNGKRNEATDIFVYNLAALELLRPNFRALARQMGVKPEEMPKPQPKEEELPQVKIRRPQHPSVTQKLKNAKRGGFMGGWR